MTPGVVTPGAGQTSLDANGVEVDTAVVVTVFDVLAHLWSRPVPEEVGLWPQARDMVCDVDAYLGCGRHDEALELPKSEEELSALLDEYEMLFVGPGPVSCPPYESFWREDVSVELRRALMGPCVGELNDLYRDLGLQVSTDSGELPDHVAIECEAVAYALGREQTHAIAQKLFEEHLNGFLARLCRAVAHETQVPFYRGLTALSVDWLAVAKKYFAATDLG